MATRVDVSFFTSDSMPDVNVKHDSLCEIIHIGPDVTLFASVDQVAYIAKVLQDAVIEGSKNATV